MASLLPRIYLSRRRGVEGGTDHERRSSYVEDLIDRSFLLGCFRPIRNVGFHGGIWDLMIQIHPRKVEDASEWGLSNHTLVARRCGGFPASYLCVGIKG